MIVLDFKVLHWHTSDAAKIRNNLFSSKQFGGKVKKIISVKNTKKKERKARAPYSLSFTQYSWPAALRRDSNG